MFKFTHKDKEHSFTIKDLIESYEDSDDDDDYFLDIEDRRKYCDREIMNGWDSFEENIDYIEGIDWISVGPTEEELPNNNKAEFRKYRSKNFEDLQLIVIETFGCEYGGRFNQIIILLTKNSFKMVACLSLHPRVETEEFAFCNTNGTGLSLIPDIDDPDKVYDYFFIYYNEFINNKNH